MPKHSRRFHGLAEKKPTEVLSVREGIKFLKSCASTKFNQTVEIAMRLGIDPRQADQLVRGSVALPKGTGKSVRIVVFCTEEKVDDVKAAGAVDAGADSLVQKVQNGWLEFDVAIASPDMMGKVGRLGRTLGPKGLMPSPKSGTVTPDVVSAVEEFKAGKIEFRNDKTGNIHAAVGKLDFGDEDLEANIRAFADHIVGMRPAAVKGVYIKGITLSGTMSPGVAVAL